MLVEQMLPLATGRLYTIDDGAPLMNAAALLAEIDTDLVVVRDGGAQLVGVITKTDIVRQIGGCSGAGCTTPAASVMTRSVVVCRPDDRLQDVWSVMKDRRLKNIPVVDRYLRPLGVLNARDTLEVLLEEVEYEEVLLRDYVMCIGYR